MSRPKALIKKYWISDESCLGRSIRIRSGAWRSSRRRTMLRADMMKLFSFIKPPWTFATMCLEKTIRIRCRAWHTSPPYTRRCNSYRRLYSQSSLWRSRKFTNRREKESCTGSSGAFANGDPTRVRALIDFCFYSRVYICRGVYQTSCHSNQQVFCVSMNRVHIYNR
jgi:hypothetical protein